MIHASGESGLHDINTQAKLWCATLIDPGRLTQAD